MGDTSNRKNDNLRKSSDIEPRILAAYGTLSRSERLLADAILAEPAGISEYSASELADRAGVSKATAARFFRRLGYVNYRAARVAARENRRRGSPLDALSELTAPLEARGNLGVHLANDVTNLTRTGESIDPEQINSAVQALTGARRVFVMGFRNSYSLAAYAFAVINTVRTNTVLLTQGNLDLVEPLADLCPDDAILAVGFRRRPLILRQLLSVARDRAAKIILLCDTKESKTAQLANIVLTCENRGTYLFDSYVAGMSLINFLCSALAMELGPAAWRRLDEIEKLHDSIDDLTNAPS
jgi:DNA-binding MurR/RpiR family transcriptional regulator